MLFRQNVRRYKTSLDHVRPWFRTRNGTKLKTRLMHPSDVALMVDLFHRLSPESRRRRFHTNVEHVSDELIFQRATELADVNQTERGALVALLDTPTGEQMVGSVRLARPAGEPDAPEAEAAIVVRDDFQGQGVGQELLRRMVLMAKKMRVKTIVAVFQPDNEPAIRLFRELNLPYTITTGHGETVMRIEVPEYDERL